MKLLLAARLSQTGTGQTGIETQDASVRQWAEAQGHKIIWTAEDHKSGTTDPWDRPGLRPWVTDPERIAQYDGIVAYRLDRLSRGPKASTNRIETWAHDHGKVLLTEDGLRFPCEGAEGIRWDVTARIAHEEWLKTSERYKRAQGWLRANGFAVGKAPYGYRIVAAAGSVHKHYEPDPETAPVVREIFRMFAGGAPMSEICEHLGGWHRNKLARILANPAYSGQRTDLLPMPELVDPATWNRVQALLRQKGTRRGRANDGTALLTGMLFCARCHSPMYRLTTLDKRSGITYRYYRCHGTGGKSECSLMLRRETVDEAACAIVAETFGSGRAYRTEPVPGHDWSADIARADLQLAQLVPQLQAGRITAAEYAAEAARIAAERERLAGLEPVPASVRKTDAGMSEADDWLTWDQQRQRARLLELGWSFTAGHGEVLLWDTRPPGDVSISLGAAQWYRTVAEA
jgi:DNA invertase Pin-like site-specific DNA recombinase